MLHIHVWVTMAWWDRWCTCLWNEIQFCGNQTPRVLQLSFLKEDETTTFIPSPRHERQVTHTVYMFSSSSLKRGSKTSCRCNTAYTTCRKMLEAVLVLSSKLNCRPIHTSGFLGNAYVRIALIISRTILKKSVYMWSSVDCKNK